MNKFIYFVTSYKMADLYAIYDTKTKREKLRTYEINRILFFKEHGLRGKRYRVYSFIHNPNWRCRYCRSMIYDSRKLPMLKETCWKCNAQVDSNSNYRIWKRVKYLPHDPCYNRDFLQPHRSMITAKLKNVLDELVGIFQTKRLFALVMIDLSCFAKKCGVAYREPCERWKYEENSLSGYIDWLGWEICKYEENSLDGYIDWLGPKMSPECINLDCRNFWFSYFNTFGNDNDDRTSVNPPRPIIRLQEYYNNDINVSKSGVKIPHYIAYYLLNS
jgi:hypothetical protein